MEGDQNKNNCSLSINTHRPAAYLGRVPIYSLLFVVDGSDFLALHAQPHGALLLARGGGAAAADAAAALACLFLVHLPREPTLGWDVRACMCESVFCVEEKE